MGRRFLLHVLKKKEKEESGVTQASGGGLLLNFRERAGDAAAVIRGGRARWTDSHRYVAMTGLGDGLGLGRVRVRRERERRSRRVNGGRILFLPGGHRFWEKYFYVKNPNSIC